MLLCWLCVKFICRALHAGVSEWPAGAYSLLAFMSPSRPGEYSSGILDWEKLPIDKHTFNLIVVCGRMRLMEGAEVSTLR